MLLFNSLLKSIYYLLSICFLKYLFKNIYYNLFYTDLFIYRIIEKEDKKKKKNFSTNNKV